MNKKSFSLLMQFAFVYLIIFGLGLWSLQNTVKPQNNLPIVGIGGAPETITDNSKAQALHNEFESILMRHVEVTAEWTEHAITTHNFLASHEDIDNISARIGEQIGGIYGPEARSAFMPLWTAQIDYYRDYAMSLAAHDERGMSTARDGLRTLSTQTGELLQRLNPKISAHSVKEALESHQTHMTNLIDMQIQENQPGVIREKQSLDHEATVLATMISNAIISQHPELYRD